MTRKSDNALGEGGQKSALRAKRWALASLRRDPTGVGAWRNLGLSQVILGNFSDGYRILRFAQTLSRRDTGTQLALLEEAVQRGDIAGALGHYDLIFRASPSQDPLLMPILVAASSDVGIRSRLVTLLRRSPPWRRRFYSELLAKPPEPGATATLVEHIAAAGALSDLDIFTSLARNLGLSGQDAAGWRVYAVLKPGRSPLLRNGDFNDPTPIAPYDWLLENGDAVSAAIITYPGSGNRLELTSSQGEAGPGARQLLALRPGKYRLSFRAGTIRTFAKPILYWQLRCGHDGAIFLKGAGTPARTATAFDVPVTGCTGQWLEFGFEVGGSDAATGAWLDQASVAPD